MSNSKLRFHSDLLERIQALKADVAAIEALIIEGGDSFDSSGSTDTGPQGPSAAILWLLKEEDANGGLTARKIVARLRNRVKTRSKDKRQVIQSTLVNLRKKKKIELVDGRYRMPHQAAKSESAKFTGEFRRAKE